MPEQHNIEYKASWKDEYIKWICAFANAQGGKLFVGINDSGDVIGLNDYKKLMDDIPNKVISLLGIVVDVNLHNKNKKPYIEISVQPSSVPISYKGVYYYRSGSTKQELKGNALQHFLLKKQGKSWDELPVEHATLKDIDLQTLKYFINKAIASKRMAVDAKSDSIKTMLGKLNLMTPDRQFTYAAILMFGKNPQRFFREAYFKIGRFGKDDADLLFQDIIDGNILQMADKVLSVLRSKYLTSPIRYEGLLRIEDLEYPEEALREAILNAIVHKDYTGTSIQLSIYKDKLILWNEGKLPEDMNIKQLKGKHPSRPRNKNIAEVFFRAGFIEVWGRGIAKINSALANAGLPRPAIEENAGGLQLTFRNKKVNDHKNDHKSDHKNDHKKEPENEVEKRFQKILHAISINKSVSIVELSKLIKISEKTISRDINKLKELKRIKRVGPLKGGFWEIVKS